MFSKEDHILKTFPLLPLRDIVIFPHMITPLFVGRTQSIHALDQIGQYQNKIFLATQQDASIDDPSEKDLYRVGTLSDVLQVFKLPNGNIKVLVEGVSRGEIKAVVDKGTFLEARIAELETLPAPGSVLTELMQRIMAQVEYFSKIGTKITPDMLRQIKKIEDPTRFTDFVAGNLTVPVAERQKLLAMTDPVERMEMLSTLIDAEVDIVKVDKRVKGRVKRQMENAQREYYLNEQMKAIRKELGKKDDLSAEAEELRAKIEAKKLPEAVNTHAMNELKKLEFMSPMFAETSVIRTYLDWIISLPWNERTKDNLKIDKAEDILEADHYGLKEVKTRIIEYLSVQQLVKKGKGPILCFVGPPGVGKTSLGKSIARAMGRNFVRVSLGGVRDEAEIRGHRRTYIGAMPGRVIQSLKKAAVVNPVFLLDEVDKMSSDFRGDPSSALLEVLDPEQNGQFSDHYLEVDYDLSNVLFICTANTTAGIPGPLMDRLEIIRIPGYTQEEKGEIAKRYLFPKQRENHGLTEDQITVDSNGLEYLIEKYTREAGVRNLEREIAALCRKVARKVVRKEGAFPVPLTQQRVREFLGPERFKPWGAEVQDEIGIATGLAWTEVGGTLLSVETTIVEGKGKLSLTGKLGDVMKESAEAALSYVRSRVEAYNLERDFYQKYDIHVHVPEGAIPKDGPSAGITLALSILSALTKQPIRRDVAMTGEITLRGRVLKIGGLKEKVLAAHRAGIRQIIIPDENIGDLEEIPENVREELQFMPVTHMDEVLAIALCIPPGEVQVPPPHQQDVVTPQVGTYT